MKSWFTFLLQYRLFLLFFMSEGVLFLLFFMSAGVLSATDQWQWFDPQQAGFCVLQGQAWSDEQPGSYARLPPRARQQLRPAVWNLSRNSAGLSIRFYTDAPRITVRYTTADKSYAMPHMPATGVSGLDMYAVTPDGQELFMRGHYAFGDTISYRYTHFPAEATAGRGYEYRLYLPLYNTITWLEIGIPSASYLTFCPQRKEPPIVVYGSSIAQGACASRPGMAWANIVARHLDQPLVNLGFSGNGLLEPPLLSLMEEIPARVYLLDCLPNLVALPTDTICNRTVAAVKQLRRSSQAPILLIEHTGYTHDGMDTTALADVQRSNQASRAAWDILRAEGFTHLYYLGSEEIALPADGAVEGVHPNDYGMMMQGKAVEKRLREILSEPIGSQSTTRPVVQRREPHVYEWAARHSQLLDTIAARPPKAVIVGNSIIHHWGGDRSAPFVSGGDSWNAYLQPEGFLNMGYGWDRIENLLWRVYHGEFDGYSADKIVIAIGTNNLSVNNTDEEIVAGIESLLSAIKQRQPQAVVKIVGILPRRNFEARIVRLNREIKKVAHGIGVQYQDVGDRLLLKTGLIDESFFRDGLHPNEMGYRRIAKSIAQEGFQ